MRCRKSKKYASEISDSDLSDSDDERPLLDHAAYQKAELSEALGRRRDYCRAVQELEHLLLSAYAEKCTKAAQELLFADVLKAVRLCCSLDEQVLIKQLVAAASILPQARRSQVLRDYKQKAVDLKRADKKSAAAKRANDSTDANNAHEGTSVEQELPPEVLDQIFAVLNPYELALACGVSQTWRAVASSDHLWQPHCSREGLSLPTNVISLGHSYRSVFAEALLADPELGLKWKCNRFIWRGRLYWRDPTVAGLTTVAGLRLANHPEEAFYPTAEQVVRQHLLNTTSFGSRAEDSSSESDSGQDPRIHGLRFWRGTGNK